MSNDETLNAMIDRPTDGINFLIDPSLLSGNHHTPTDPSPITYPTLTETQYHRSMDSYISGLVGECAPEDVSDQLKAIIDLHLRSNNAVLMHSNFEAYTSLMLTDAAHEPAIVAIIEMAKKSQASPYELLALNLLTDLRSVELKKLTHPYGLRQEYVDQMEEQVSDAIIEHGGVLLEDQGTEVNILPHQFDTTGFIVTSRDFIGKIDDVIVRKRRTYVVNVDSPEFRPDIKRQIKKISKNLPHDEWFRQIKEETGLQGYVETSIIEGRENISILPLSTMIYSYHADRKRPKDKMAIKKAQSLQVARHALKLNTN